jgi:hypothetical protein
MPQLSFNVFVLQKPAARKQQYGADPDEQIAYEPFPPCAQMQPLVPLPNQHKPVDSEHPLKLITSGLPHAIPIMPHT